MSLHGRSKRRGKIPLTPGSPEPLTFSRTEAFARDFKSLPKAIQDRVEKALVLLGRDPRHPSLRTRKMHGPGDIWEASVSMSYRITFQWIGNQLILRRVGSHDILRKET